MNYVDIAIIAVIALFALIGLWKGFGKTLIKLFCFALALAATWYIASYALTSILGVGFIRDLVTGNGKVSLYTLYYNSLGEEVLNATAGTTLDGAMGMFINPMIARFTALGGPDAYNITYAQFVALNLSINTLSIALCLILYVVVRLVVALIAWILKKIFIHGEVRAWSRFVGFVFGAVRGAAIVMVALIVSTVVFPFGFASGYAETAGRGVIGKFACEYTYKAYDALTYGSADNSEKIEKILTAAGIEKVTLDKIKSDAIADLEAYKAEKVNADEYSDAGKANLDACVDNGKSAINAAENRDGVNTALETAKANIDAVLNKQQETERDEAKKAKKDALTALKTQKLGENNERAADYSESNVAAIKTLYNEGYVALDQGKTVAEIESIYGNYEKQIKAIPTVVEEALATAKKEGIRSINEYVVTETESVELSEADRATISEIQLNGTLDINNATTAEEVDEIVANTKLQIRNAIDTAQKGTTDPTTPEA